MLGERLKELRLDVNLSQKQLAGIIGVTENSISKYESNSREPSSDILIKIANYFNVSLDYLLGRTNIKTPHYVLSEIELITESKDFANIIDIIRKNIKSINFMYSLLRVMEENKKL